MAGAKHRVSVASSYSEWTVHNLTSNPNQLGSSLEFLTNVLMVNNVNIE